MASEIDKQDFEAHIVIHLTDDDHVRSLRLVAVEDNRCLGRFFIVTRQEDASQFHSVIAPNRDLLFR